MKLLRYGPSEREQPGLLDGKGGIRDLSNYVRDIDTDCLEATTLLKLAKLDPYALPLVNGVPRLGTPVTGVGKCVAIGLNYIDHAQEANLPIPKEPLVFLKATSSLCGPNDTVVLPELSTKGDWEVELGIIIGRRASYVEEEDALDHVAGYCIVNDVSEREYQLERGGSWDKGKGFDTFGPVGPWLVTPDEVGDPQALDNVARRERRAHADRQHAHHDLQLRGSHQPRQPDDDFAARRHHHDRYPARSGSGEKAEAHLSQARGCHDARNREIGRAAPAGGGVAPHGGLSDDV
jgi:2-keto-4-pentenoate hydratase/2-oxohepta-3-ene-1,7-dioic acid hydratase in catechol pathway